MTNPHPHRTDFARKIFTWLRLISN